MLTMLLATGLLLPRAARLHEVHPYPNTWAGHWLGVDAEAMIMLGWGEGMREAGRFIAADAAGARPKVWAGMFAKGLKPWLTFRRIPRRRMRQAEYIVRFISLRQRNWWEKAFKKHLGPKLHTVELGGRSYVDIHAGPAYRKAARSGRAGP